jgi:hypothetical protein
MTVQRMKMRRVHEYKYSVHTQDIIGGLDCTIVRSKSTQSRCEGDRGRTDEPNSDSESCRVRCKECVHTIRTGGRGGDLRSSEQPPLPSISYVQFRVGVRRRVLSTSTGTGTVSPTAFLRSRPSRPVQSKHSSSSILEPSLLSTPHLPSSILHLPRISSKFQVAPTNQKSATVSANETTRRGLSIALALVRSVRACV